MNFAIPWTRFAALCAFALLCVPPAGAQQKPASAPNSGASGMNMEDLHRDTENYPEAARTAMEAMSMHDMDANPHMFMTALRPRNAADDQRATEILGLLRPSIERFKDYKIALRDGYHIFLPNVPQQVYHFTNWRYAYEAVFVFNPSHPTSLLYRKTKTGYDLIGAMYTAPRDASESELNQRVPLSVARWHKHVRFCMPPKGAQLRNVDWKQFGLAGSISSAEGCAQAGGRWVPEIFNWMVHVYPFETDPGKIWAH